MSKPREGGPLPLSDLLDKAERTGLLDLSFRDLDDLPPEIGDLHTLTKLDLHFNRFAISHMGVTVNVPLCLCATVYLCHCATAPLCLCATVPVCHCATARTTVLLAPGSGTWELHCRMSLPRAPLPRATVTAPLPPSSHTLHFDVWELFLFFFCAPAMVGFFESFCLMRPFSHFGFVWFFVGILSGSSQKKQCFGPHSGAVVCIAFVIGCRLSTRVLKWLFAGLLANSLLFIGFFFFFCYWLCVAKKKSKKEKKKKKESSLEPFVVFFSFFFLSICNLSVPRYIFRNSHPLPFPTFINNI
jgi:hypothetical protein